MQVILVTWGEEQYCSKQAVVLTKFPFLSLLGGRHNIQIIIQL